MTVLLLDLLRCYCSDRWPFRVGTFHLFSNESATFEGRSSCLLILWSACAFMSCWSWVAQDHCFVVSPPPRFRRSNSTAPGILVLAVLGYLHREEELNFHFRWIVAHILLIIPSNSYLIYQKSALFYHYSNLMTCIDSVSAKKPYYATTFQMISRCLHFLLRLSPISCLLDSAHQILFSSLLSWNCPRRSRSGWWWWHWVLPTARCRLGGSWCRPQRICQYFNGLSQLLLAAWASRNSHRSQPFWLVGFLVCLESQNMQIWRVNFACLGPNTWYFYKVVWTYLTTLCFVFVPSGRTVPFLLPSRRALLAPNSWCRTCTRGPSR